MQSKAPDVDSYIAEAPLERQAALRRIRELCLREMPEHREAMAYGMATYARDGRAEFAFASQKQHLSLYLMNPAVAEKHAAALADLDMGKGCIRFRKPDAIDFELLARLLRDTASRPAAAS